MLLLGVAGEESWESLSEDFRVALMTALTVGEGALGTVGRRLYVELLQNKPRNISHVWDGGRQRRSEATTDKHCLGLWVGGGAARVEGCCVCGMPRMGMGVESPAGMREMKPFMLICIPRWCDVGDCPRARGVGVACKSCQGSSRRGVVGVSSDVRVQRRRRRFQAERCMS